LVREMESNGERNRGLYVIKSRGMAHSNQVREFLLTDEGVKLVPVYLGSEGVLTGSARLAQEAGEVEERISRQQEIELKQAELERKRKAMEEQIATLRAEFDIEQDRVERTIKQATQREERIVEERSSMARKREVKLSSEEKLVRARAAGGTQ
jgi:circadian clock protein KaiC